VTLAKCLRSAAGGQERTHAYRRIGSINKLVRSESQQQTRFADAAIPYQQYLQSQGRHEMHAYRSAHEALRRKKCRLLSKFMFVDLSALCAVTPLVKNQMAVSRPSILSFDRS
jgi:hypothetical protein